jgi:RND family efflux transporter MFP subunit
MDDRVSKRLLDSEFYSEPRRSDMRLLSMWFRRLAGASLCFAAAASVPGCSDGPAPDALKMPPPAVTVSYPIERNVQDNAEFTGRTAAVESVKVRSRVFGHLMKINFTDGAMVKAGDVLFVIDQRPYKAALLKAQADMAQTDARAVRMKQESTRGRSLLAKDAISREEFDKIEGDLLESEATLRSTTAALETAKLNLDYTEVRAPIDGLISRRYVTVGNLIDSPETGMAPMLTTIVSITPMYAYFDVDDLTYLKIKPLVDNQAGNNAGKAAPVVELAIGDERDFPHRGTIDFVDNQVEPGTGTMRMRGVFKNEDRVLTPGLFAHVRVPLGDPHPAILVTDRAIDTDQGLKIVYVINRDNVVEKRSVRLGRVHDSLREIQEGIKVGDRVVVDGIHRIRPGVTVDPKLVEMPVYQDPRRAGVEPAKTKSP